MSLDKFLNKVICGDCLEVMKELPNKSIDLIITDPPFFMPTTHYQSRVKWQRKFSDISPLRLFWKTHIIEFIRILKNTGHLFVFCNCDSYPVFYEPTYDCFDKLKSLVWDKTRIGLGHIFRHQHELIIWARWQDSKTIKPNGKLRSDIIQCAPTLSNNRQHPVEKPTKLIERLIEPTSDKNDIVLDPFMGSGTTLEAAKNLNRNFIGIDVDQEYCKIAEKRLAQEVLL